MHRPPHLCSTIASTRSGRPRPQQQHAARTPATARAASWPLPKASGGVLRSRRRSAAHQMRRQVGDSSAAPRIRSPGISWRAACQPRPPRPQQQPATSCAAAAARGRRRVLQRVCTAPVSGGRAALQRRGLGAVVRCELSCATPPRRVVSLLAPRPPLTLRGTYTSEPLPRWSSSVACTPPARTANASTPSPLSTLPAAPPSARSSGVSIRLTVRTQPGRRVAACFPYQDFVGLRAWARPRSFLRSAETPRGSRRPG